MQAFTVSLQVGFARSGKEAVQQLIYILIHEAVYCAHMLCPVFPGLHLGTCTLLIWKCSLEYLVKLLILNNTKNMSKLNFISTYQATYKTYL